MNRRDVSSGWRHLAAVVREMSVFSLGADGARWMLGTLLILACAEKVSSLLSRATAWHPVMLVSATRRRFSRLLMGGSLLADASTVLLLMVAPRVGAALASALMLLYTWAAMSAHQPGDHSSCRCFFRVVNTRTKLGLIVRNGWLVGASLAVFVWHPHASWTGIALGGVLLGGTLGLTVVMDRLAEVRRALPERRDGTLRDPLSARGSGIRAAEGTARGR